MEGIRVREATLADAEELARLVAELRYPTATDQMHARLSAIQTDPNAITFVAEADANVVAMADATICRYYELDGLYSRLVALVVSKGARRRGIGTKLVRELECCSITSGARAIVVNSGSHRKQAHEFYERLGHIRTGYRFVRQIAGDSDAMPQRNGARRNLE